jgi:hypothetical protein
MFNSDNVAPVCVIASVVIIFVALHWLTVSPPLHDDSIARTAAIITLLVAATAAAAITMRD